MKITKQQKLGALYCLQEIIQGFYPDPRKLPEPFQERSVRVLAWVSDNLPKTEPGEVAVFAVPESEVAEVIYQLMEQIVAAEEAPDLTGSHEPPRIVQ